MVTRIIFDIEEQDWFKCESQFNTYKTIHRDFKFWAKHNNGSSLDHKRHSNISELNVNDFKKKKNYVKQNF